ncbi:hypothetical protein TI04_04585 [Achromatium sp. WMS2]|nr:hypothetical protein TI04_04585 [Achromatium sp. WMS2]
MLQSQLTCAVYNTNFTISSALYQHLYQYYTSKQYTTEYRRRSHIFVPLNKPRFLEKIGNGDIAADGFIWDLEDSVPNDQKHIARQALANLPKKPGNVEYNVRINCGTPEELDLDIQAIAKVKLDSVTLPKGESAAEILRLIRLIGEDKAYIVTIETLKGLHAIDEIASVLKPGRDALGFGAGDMSTDMGIERTSICENTLFRQMLCTIAMTGKRYNLDLFDGVSARFNDPEFARIESEFSCYYLGYTGKKLINPKQLAPINEVFTPRKSIIAEQLATLDSFLASPTTNAHVVGNEYKGMPAFKSATKNIEKLLRQGYLELA